MLGTLFRFAYRAGIVSLVVKALLNRKRSAAPLAARTTGSSARRDGF